jgi:hypothetical protein
MVMHALSRLRDHLPFLFLSYIILMHFSKYISIIRKFRVSEHIFCLIDSCQSDEDQTRFRDLKTKVETHSVQKQKI